MTAGLLAGFCVVSLSGWDRQSVTAERVKEKLFEVVGHNSSVHLNRYAHFTQLMRDSNIKVVVERFKSAFDNSWQKVLILAPFEEKIQKVVFFFHGMDGDCGDAVVVNQLLSGTGIKIVSLGGRGPAWLSDAFVADAIQLIREQAEDNREYYLMGISMGGTQALAMAGLLPEAMSRSLAGVIAFIPGVDLVNISQESSSSRVRDTLLASVSGNIEKLSQRSPVRLIKRYRKGLPFVLQYNNGDTVLPGKPLGDFLEKLDEEHPLSVFVEPGEHNYTHLDLDLVTIFREVGNESVELKQMPRLQPISTL